MTVIDFSMQQPTSRFSNHAVDLGMPFPTRVGHKGPLCLFETGRAVPAELVGYLRGRVRADFVGANAARVLGQ